MTLYTDTGLKKQEQNTVNVNVCCHVMMLVTWSKTKPVHRKATMCTCCQHVLQSADTATFSADKPSCWLS